MKFFAIFRRKLMADCGHKTLRTDRVTAFGTSCKTKIPINNGRTDYCHRCLEKMAIRCAWCGEVIFIGDPVTLYSPRDAECQMPEYAVLYNKDHNSYVGCLRWNCAETGADRAGFWYPPGRVVRTPSPLEVAMQSGEAVCVGDLGDLEEAMRLCGK